MCQSVQKERQQDNAGKQTLRSYSEKFVYWCCHGPEDNRDKKRVDPKVGVRRSAVAAGESIKTGCTFRIGVTRLLSHQDHYLLRVHHDHLDHVDSSGSPCHPDQSSRFSTGKPKYPVPPALSSQVKGKVLQLVDAGWTDQKILAEIQHQLLQPYMVDQAVDRGRAIEQLLRSGGQDARDYALSKQDIENIRNDVNRATWRRHRFEEESLNKAMHLHPEYFPFYKPLQYQLQPAVTAPAAAAQQQMQQQVAAAPPPPQQQQQAAAAPPPPPRRLAATVPQQAAAMGRQQQQAEALPPYVKDLKDVCVVQDFNLLFGTPEQFKRLAELTHNGPLLMDATFSTNHWQYPLITFMGVDEFGNGFPGAWALTSSENCVSTAAILRNLQKTMEKYVPGWRPSCVIVDDASTGISATEAVFGADMRVHLCVWHVKRCWLKHLITKVKQEHRWSMFSQLSDIMMVPTTVSTQPDVIRDTVKLRVQQFLNQWQTSEPAFVKVRLTRSRL